MSIPVSGNAKNNLVLGLAALVCHGSGVDASADNLSAAITASGNEVPAFWAPLYAQLIEKAGGADKFFTKIGGGGGAAAPAAASAAAPAKAAVVEKPKVEEVDALEGGMDMFGGGGSDY